LTVNVASDALELWSVPSRATLAKFVGAAPVRVSAPAATATVVEPPAARAAGLISAMAERPRINDLILRCNKIDLLIYLLRRVYLSVAAAVIVRRSYSRFGDHAHDGDIDGLGGTVLAALLP
jgi:hypothetical protein